MITGDKRAKAEALGDELGFDVVHAEVAPEDKASLVRALQAEGQRAAFIGNGINDAGPGAATALARRRGGTMDAATAPGSVTSGV